MKPISHNGSQLNATIPPIRMDRHLPCRIMRALASRRPESGGILLGPIGCDDITDFYFDATAECTGATYTPDHVTLGRKLKQQWLPVGVDFKGFVHSHPRGCDRLSWGDMRYIQRLLAKNPDMNFFAAPIVNPQEFCLRPIIVLREQPQVQRPTTFMLF
jgi:hypothetical protein